MGSKQTITEMKKSVLARFLIGGLKVRLLVERRMTGHVFGQLSSVHSKKVVEQTLPPS